ncbi:hypothetical protein MOC55_11825 [Bacillus spizizenii]|uniref:Uncharacterized protein n=1 Tax=Bacillus spizizenii TaxID=96241 RepID=A0A9Q4DL44_BACSC|nr:hypothetical protein [Bacillus spizizenii]MCY8155155.1 hypothetical protein [Bacillus spizizenii]MCY8196577.1 hypothetical protein [Bacillus spizizenii]MCY8219347.1 hypothetical protein [Bacillus spizizenii]MCY8312975.1 hypothetical protein [Bacillus spizizenii]
MATKTEMIEELYKAGVDTKTNLKKLETEALEEMVQELEASTEVGDETTETNEVSEIIEDAPTSEESEESNNKVVTETVHQLGIFTEFIYHAKNENVSLKVENLGNGDVYVNAGKVQVGDKDQRLLKGEGKVFKDVAVVNLMAASQPEVKISELE